ncbi:MAG: hypothetical protein ACK5NN_06245 [Sphingomonadaceae bacterium]
MKQLRLGLSGTALCLATAMMAAGPAAAQAAHDPRTDERAQSSSSAPSSAPTPVPSPVPSPDTEPSLSLEQRTGVRCSVAFALVSAMQDEGEAQNYPALGNRGREFFVRSAAQLMDDTGMRGETIRALFAEEARNLGGPENLDAIMPACLLMLDASGL